MKSEQEMRNLREALKRYAQFHNMTGDVISGLITSTCANVIGWIVGDEIESHGQEFLDSLVRANSQVNSLMSKLEDAIKQHKQRATDVSNN